MCFRLQNYIFLQQIYFCSGRGFYMFFIYGRIYRSINKCCCTDLNIYTEAVGITTVKFPYLEFPVFTNGKKSKEWNLVGVTFIPMHFETGEIFKPVKNSKCLVICFVLYSSISRNEPFFFICSDRPLRHHTHFASTHYFYWRNVARKNEKSRTELEIFIQLSELIKGARYLTRFPSIHLTIAVTVVTFVKIIVINHHTIGRCGRWLETELCRLYTEIYRPPYEIC